MCTIFLAVIVAVPTRRDRRLASWRLAGPRTHELLHTRLLRPGIRVGVSLDLAGFAETRMAAGIRAMSTLSDGFVPFIRHLILPSFTLSLIYIALIARVTRAAVSEALIEDFVRTARAKGLSEWRVLIQHALANSAVPIVTVIGIGLTLLLGGVVVTERIYAIHGLGDLTVTAVLARDFRVVQGVILLFSVTCVLVNLFVDLTYLIFDPRIRY